MLLNFSDQTRTGVFNVVWSYTLTKTLPATATQPPIDLWKYGANRKERKIMYNTAYSQAVTHPSTNTAQCCLTSVIGRELVLSTWYGRTHLWMSYRCHCTNSLFDIEKNATLPNKNDNGLREVLL